MTPGIPGLKPCPFCGGTAQYENSDLSNHEWIACTSCGASAGVQEWSRRAALSSNQKSAGVALGGEKGEPPCNPHPDAPHGYNRNASHNAGRYVCDCEGWAALGGEKGEAVAWQWQTEDGQVGFIDPWQKESGWEQANPRAKLIRPLFAAPVGKARMLTDEEADHITGMHNTGRAQGDSECAEAIQRKFCEVNGITLEAK